MITDLQLSKQRRKRKEMIYKSMRFFTALGIALITIIPFLWMVISSLQPNSSSLFYSPPRFPNPIRFQNYIDAIKEIKMFSLIWNTLILVFANMFLSIGASIFVAYGFARFRIKERNILFFILLSTMMLPWVVTLVPSYIIFNKIGWIGTRWPLILPAIGGNAFFIFLLRQYIMGIPVSLDEAATIDGCNRLGILFKIILPQCKPIIATLIVFSFTGTWSDYVGPRIYLASSPQLQTLSIGLQYFQSTNSVMPWHLLMAACVIFAIPMVVVMFSAQNALARGIVTSGIKE